MTGGQAVGNIAETGGKAVEVIIDKTPGAKETIANAVIP